MLMDCCLPADKQQSIQYHPQQYGSGSYARHEFPNPGPDRRMVRKQQY